MDEKIRQIAKLIHCNHTVKPADLHQAMLIGISGIKKALANFGQNRSSIARGTNFLGQLALRNAIGIKLGNPMDADSFNRALQAAKASNSLRNLDLHAEDSSAVFEYDLARVMFYCENLAHQSGYAYDYFKAIDNALLKAEFELEKLEFAEDV